MTDEVKFYTNDKGLATITLNRPKALNSLTHEMVVAMKEHLNEWRDRADIQVILIEGAGEKGFCAGGDIKTLSQARNGPKDFEKARRFFEDEYEVDLMIQEYPKPIAACLDGIVMGGGVGLTQGASHRIVTERTKWAMPEMNIGFFPDVGGAYFFNKAPGYTGRYLALTSSTIKAADILYIHAADYYVSNLKPVIDELITIDWTQEHDPAAKLTSVITVQHSKPEAGMLSSIQDDINHYFQYDSVETIVEKLESDSTHSFAAETRETLLAKSPVSEKVTLKHLIDSENKSLEDVLQMDLVIATGFLKHEDFYKGIESVIFKKNHSPAYTYKHLADVSENMVESFFTDK
ncbi:enoyl-CoA hydratase/carnithine racemase [Geomicrobium halophilum]|uniref:3-hydroxyisobutyryl-CoA hydrolase n=1 Tax=Geomicrobium halophilum TaxID=549000 RepID=A0A841PX29_9BACL|nr:enoyl-CoA hydratase/isomerase family protein [Geomicrobium halophilum]MBB6451151.1 enoyl-CoA hydratase/carnithine racemase [Geomicrobium halophilum]